MTNHRGTIHRHLIRILAVSGLVAAALPQGALAADANAVADRFKAALGDQAISLSWSGVSGDGTSEVVLSGVTMTNPGMPPVPIGDMTLADIEETDGGGFEIGSATLPPSSFESEGHDIAFGGMTISGLDVPGAGAPASETLFYESAEIPSLTVAKAGKTLFAMNDFAIDVTLADDGTMAFEGGADSFSADLSEIDDPNSKMAAEALGFTQVEGEYEIAGSWAPGDGRTKLDQFDITIKDAGTIGMTFDFAGYTPAFLKALKEVQDKMATGGEQEQSAQGLAMLGLMQQLTLHGASVRFDDDTLTEKVLAFVAKQQNASPADIANQAKAVLPFALAQLNNPELTALISAAVNTFLDNPESLEIAIQPAQPIPFAMIAASAMTAPQGLPQQLRLKVVANDEE